MLAQTSEYVYKLRCEGREVRLNLPPRVLQNDDLLVTALKASMPKIIGAVITRHNPQDGVVVIEVAKKHGPKGSSSPVVAALIGALAGENPAVLLYRRVAVLDLAQLSAAEIAVLDADIETAQAEGDTLYRQMQAAVGRLKESAPLPSPYPVLL